MSAAIAEWYEHYAPDIVRFARSYGFTPEDADDLCASVFLEAMERQPYDDQPRAWLYRVARSRIITRWRYDARRTRLALTAVLPSVDGPEPPDDALVRAVRTLPAMQRRVIVARFVADRTLEDVATELGTNANAIKSLQHRALVRLRRVLGANVLQ